MHPVVPSKAMKFPQSHLTRKIFCCGCKITIPEFVCSRINCMLCTEFTILSLPHCDFNPIKLIWDMVKKVAAKSVSTIFLSNLKEMTRRSVSKITKEDVNKGL
jgi:hypothetical protein